MVSYIIGGIILAASIYILYKNVKSTIKGESCCNSCSSCSLNCSNKKI